MTGGPSQPNFGEPAPARGDAARRLVERAFEARLNAYLDGELDDAGRRSFESLLERDPAAAKAFAATAAALACLRNPLPTPDFSSSVLGAVESRRSRSTWLDASGRRALRIGRVAVAAALLGALCAAIGLRSRMPAEALSSQPAPLSDVIAASQSDAQRGLRDVAGVVESAQAAVFTVVNLARAPHPAAQPSEQRVAIRVVAPRHPAPAPEFLPAAWTPVIPADAGAGRGVFIRQTGGEEYAPRMALLRGG